MTFFGILWLCIVIWAFLKSNIKYMLTLVLLFMTFQCANVLDIAGIGIGPQILTSVAFVVKALVAQKGVIRIGRKHRIYIFLSIAMATVALASCIYNDILKEQILYVLQLFIYVICFISIIIYSGQVNSKTIYQILRRIIIFLLIMGVIQILTTMEILPLRALLKALFYNDTSTSVYFHHSNYPRIMSTFMEPSYFAGLIVGAFYYLLSMSSRWRENYIIMAAIVLELILTMSSTAYAAFVIVGLIFILIQKRIKLSWKITIVVVALVGFVVLYFGFYDVLDAVIFSKSETGSYLTRTNMNNKAYQTYLGSPLLGVGYRYVRGSSIIYSLLGQLGVLGLTAYFMFNIAVFVPIALCGKNQFRFTEIDIGIRYAVLSACVCQLISCPDLDLCTYWFWIYAMGISIRNSDIQNKQ